MRWFARFRREVHSEAKPQGFLARLRDDKRGATLAMMAAVVIPMIGMVGGAVDISRAYLVKVRLQQACDAGVLAARRTMTGSSIASDTNAQTQATNFFKINLKNGAYGATVTPIAVTDVMANGKATGTVHGAASATVPTTLMRVFGKTSLTMNASCEATLQVANNDVMFVLDVTGSMNCAATDSPSTCSNNNHVEKSNAKIKAVRTAVVDFYDTLKAATTQTAQLRIGIVPYSTNANVGKLLYAKDPSWIVDSFSYQSRVANYTTPAAGPPNPPTVGSPTTQVFSNGTGITQTNCSLYGQNKAFNDSNGGYFGGGTNPVSGGGPAPTPTTSTAYANNNTTGVDWSYSGAPDRSGSYRSCRRSVTVTTTTYSTVYKWNGTWNYLQESFDTSAFKTGNPITYATGTTGTVNVSGSYNPLELVAAPGATGLTTSTLSWTGCIEERDTVAQSTFSSIPSNAYDLQIDLTPNNAATTWRPWWPQMIYYRGSVSSVNNSSTDQWQPSDFGTDAVACPKQAQKMAVLTHNDVYNYVNASDFKANGNTYHDVGMLWGARLLSPTGIFGDENSTAPNGLPINRSIVFMTDGDMMPSQYADSLYGFENLDRRISGSTNTPNDTDLKNRHNSRFLAICQAIKDMNITIYVVAYSQTMTTELSTCATPGKAFYASDDDELSSAFQQIAKQIAQLRLSA